MKVVPGLDQGCSSSTSTQTGEECPAGSSIQVAIRPERPELEKTVQRIYNMFKKVGGGADGGVVGFNGSVKARCLVEGFTALEIKGKHLIDFGAGDGRVLLSAIAAGACSATGYELPDNAGHQMLFDCVQQRCEVEGKENAAWEAKDIDRLASIKDGSVVFTFWVGMPAETQTKILELCAQNNVGSLLVFRDSKWKKPDEIIQVLNEKSSSGTKRRFTWMTLNAQTPNRHSCVISMDMMGSHEGKTAWVFTRHERVRNPYAPVGKRRGISKRAYVEGLSETCNSDDGGNKKTQKVGE